MQTTSKRLYKYIVKQKKKILLGAFATLLMSLIELLTGSLLKTLINLIDEFSGSFANGVAENIKLHIKYKINLPLFNDSLQVINQKLTGPDEIFKGMIYLCLLFVIIYFLLALCNYARRMYMNAAAQRILQNFKNDIYQKILRLPYSFYSKNKTGDVVSRITYDVVTLNEIIELFIEVARASVYMLIFVPVMFALSWQLSLFTILFFPASIFLIEYVSRHIKKVSKKLTDNVGDYTAFLEEKINRFKLIKGFRTEKKEAAEFSNLVEDNYQYNLRLIKLKFSMNPTNDFLGMISLSVIFIFYSYRLTSGHASLGEIVFYIYLVRTAYKPIKKVAQAWGQLHIALVSTRKIFRLMDESEERQFEDNLEKTPLNAIESLRFNRVSFQYSNIKENRILKDTSFEIQKGEIALFSGKTGAGKSTLLNLIPGFLTPQSGDILLNEIKQTTFSLNQIRSRIALVDGTSLLINGTIKQNIEYGGIAMTVREQKEFSDFIGLKNQFELDLLVGKDGIDLSEGQKQKLAFIQAIITQPSVLILDEIFSSLDSEDIDYVLKKCDNTDIVILVTRIKQAEQYATKFYEIEEGKIIRRK